QSKRSSELEVCFKLFSDAAKPVQVRSRGREIRQGLAGLTRLAKQHRSLQERFCVDERIDLRARRDYFIELRFRLHGVTGGRGVGRELDPDTLDRRGGDRKGE